MRLLTFQQVIVHDRSKSLNFFRRSDRLCGRHWRLVFYHVVRREPASLSRVNSCSFPPFINKIFLAYQTLEYKSLNYLSLTIRRHHDSWARWDRPSWSTAHRCWSLWMETPPGQSCSPSPDYESITLSAATAIVRVLWPRKSISGLQVSLSE